MHYYSLLAILLEIFLVMYNIMLILKKYRVTLANFHIISRDMQRFRSGACFCGLRPCFPSEPCVVAACWVCFFETIMAGGLITGFGGEILLKNVSITPLSGALMWVYYLQLNLQCGCRSGRLTVEMHY